VWRKVLVSVSPEKIYFAMWSDAQNWAEMQFREVPVNKLVFAKDLLYQSIEPSGLAVSEVSPDLFLSGSLGLYVFNGCASFRNTVVRPGVD
jgi:hypothetical protein